MMPGIDFRTIWWGKGEEMGGDIEETRWRFIVLFSLLVYRPEMRHNNRLKTKRSKTLLLLVLLSSSSPLGFFSASSVPDPVLNTFHTVSYLVFSRIL